MSLDHLWAGWRASYVASFGGEGEGPEPVESVAPQSATECVFCRIIASDASDDDRHVVHTTDTSIVLLNAYPYASGHLLVMPIRHVAELSELSEEESADLWSTTTKAAAAIESAYQPDGMNLGANLGRAAGAGIPRHLHLHAVPRWVGDTNFMTAIAAVRVLPEALSVSWSKLREHWPT